MKRNSFRILGRAAAACCALILAAAAPTPKPAPEQQTGIKIGEEAPAFTLKDQTGKEVSLESLLKNGPAALVFTRSADWCPFCKKQLVQLQKDLPALKEAGIEVVSISYDPASKLKRFAEAQSITYPLLSDEGSKTIDAYGIRNMEVKKGSDHEGIPYPGTYLVDREGIVRDKIFLVGYAARASNDDLIAKAKALK